MILVVMDGLGDISGGKGTPLEVAKTPNLDNIAQNSICGMQDPIAPGITPGSGPAHLGLFGYDPISFDIGRGILSALGVDFELKPSDVAARMNFCTLGKDGIITDRRAGRIPTEKCVELCQELSQIKVSGLEIFVKPEKEYRAAVIFRGESLSGNLCDTDPQKVGHKPNPVQPTDTSSDTQRTAKLVSEFVEKASKILADHHPANMVLLRGFAKYDKIPLMPELYKMSCAAIANYPMYRGVARLVGMNVLSVGSELEDEFDLIEKIYKDFDYYFFHVKKTDSYGEDGNFDAKVKVIERVDSLIPRIVALKPDCLVITGDHSTPCKMKSHSFHPVPIMLMSPDARVDTVKAFNETSVLQGGLGRISSTDIIALMLAHAQRLEKYGA